MWRINKRGLGDVAERIAEIGFGKTDRIKRRSNELCRTG